VQRRASQYWSAALRLSRRSPWVRRVPGAAVARQGPKSGKPGDRERCQEAQGVQPVTDSRCAVSETLLWSRGAFACAAASSRGALGAPLKT
jgi:hypothetical protein